MLRNRLAATADTNPAELFSADMTEPPKLTNAHPWRRLMCIVYECVILFGVLWLANYVFSSLTTFKDDSDLLRTVSQVVLVVVMAAYFGWQWSAGRRTLPMKTLDLQVVDREGRYLTPARALLRYGAALVMLVVALAITRYMAAGALLMLLPASWALIDPQRRALYDIVAGTQLVMQSAREVPGRTDQAAS